MEQWGGSRFGGNANNGNCAPRNVNANNAFSNTNQNYGCSWQNWIKHYPVVSRSEEAKYKTYAYEQAATPKLMEIIINRKDIEQGVLRAIKGHETKKEVVSFCKDMERGIDALYYLYLRGTWKYTIKYRKLTKVNNNGKVRKIKSPSFITRVWQHTFLSIVEPYYFAQDNLMGVNCKPNCGITAKSKNRSVLKRVKHLFYDLTDLNYCLIADQRKCYEHITPRVYRKGMKLLGMPKNIIDFGEAIGFVDGSLPIGTPTSPMIHHIVMIGFDRMIGTMPFAIRYADDCLMAFATKEEANQAKWRVQNYWWYELGVRAKRNTLRMQPLSESLDFCGYIFHRNNGKRGSQHDKGYTTVRHSTIKRAMFANNGNWSSYFGIMKYADAFGLMRKIEKDMKLSELTNKIKINRELDARNIEVKDLDTGIIFTIYDYQIRKDAKGITNWIKMLIGIPEMINNEKTGKILAREFHGNYQGIIQYILLLEKEYKKSEILPLEEVEITNSCGYIFKGSTNQINYI